MTPASPWLLHHDTNVFEGSHRSSRLTPKGLDLLLQGLLNVLRTINVIVISLTPAFKTEHPHKWS